MTLNDKLHTSSIINSLNKAYNQSKLNGKLVTEDIYLLDSIYKLLDGCEMSLNNKQLKNLKELYISILNNSKYICKTPIFKTYYSKEVIPFVQAESQDCNNIPKLDLIYYWQESLGVLPSTILANIATDQYLQTKPSDLKSKFIEGKDINYTDIGLICFALNDVLVIDNYHIYDDDNDSDVTLGFESFYNTELKTRIFISYNIYSYGLMNFKIKKI